LSSNSWTALPIAPVIGDGKDVFVTDPGAASSVSNRFYRLKLQ
jgi:hypothetical protein